MNLDPVARWVLEAGLHAAALTLLVGVIVRLCRRCLSPGARHALWLLVAVRLCLPPLPILPFALFPPLGSRTLAVPERDFTVIASRPSGSPIPETGSRSIAAAGTVRHAAAEPPGAGWSSWLWIAWALGSAFLAIRFAAAVSANRRLRGALIPVRDTGVLELLARSAARGGVRRLPGLLAGEAMNAPALCGFLRPRILIPERLLAPGARADLEDVLRHELAHLKRGDVLVERVLSVLEIIHWPNVVCRWAFARLREERELACDELAVRWSGDGDGSRYASTLLRLAETVSSRPAPAAAGILGGRRLETRIRSLMEPRPRKTSRALAAGLIGGCAVAGFTCSSGGEPGGGPVTKVYDLGVLAEDRDFLAPRLGVSTEKYGVPAPESEDMQRLKRSTGIAGRLREAVPEDLRDDCNIEAQSGAVLVYAPEAVQDRIEAALRKLLADREILVSVQVQLVAVDEPWLASLPPALGRDARLVRDGTRLEPRALASEEVEALLEGTGPGPPRIESRPSITLFQGQTSHTMVVNQAAHIVDTRGSEREDGKPEPVIGILSTGFVVQVTATVSGDGKSVGLDLEAEWGDVKKPVAWFDVEGQPVEAPEMALRSAQLKLEAPRGVWMLAGGFPGRHWAEPRETMLWLVKAEIPEGE